MAVDVSSWQILLQKYFWVLDRNFQSR